MVSEPPRWTIRRTAILCTSLLLLVVGGVPAWAGASIAPAEVPADADQPLTLTVTEPEDEAYGDTTRVVVTAPEGFTVLDCGTVGWTCAVADDGTRVTFTRAVALGDTYELGFSVHTPGVNGTYAFRVTQADGPASEEDPPATVSSRPAITVTGGTDPEPEPTATPTPPPAGDGGAQDDTGSSSSPADDPTPAPGTTDGTGTGGDTSSDDPGSSSGGSTAPRRTQGRASGTTLEISPGDPAADGDALAPPAVADDPAIALPGDGPATGEDDDAAAAATGTQPSDDPGGPPWQQLVGAALLLVGGAVVAIRRWDLTGRPRGLELLAPVRRWRQG